MGFLLEFVEALAGLEIAEVSLESLAIVGLAAGFIYAAFNLGPLLRDKVFAKPK